MRYRLEMIDGLPTVRNVETDVALGTVVGAGDQYRQVNFESVLNWEGKETSVWPPQPLERAISTIAFNEAFSGYPGLQNCTARPDPARVEFALGNILAETVSTLASGLLEHQKGGLREETKNGFGDLMVQIFDIRWASSFGSFNAETRQDEPYFINTRSGARMSFEDAAQFYGMDELRYRLPHVNEALLQELLSWALKVLKDATDDLLPVRSSTPLRVQPNLERASQFPMSRMSSEVGAAGSSPKS